MITLSHNLQLRTAQFLSNIKLLLERKEQAGTITDEELMQLFEARSITDKIVEENQSLFQEQPLL